MVLYQYYNADLIDIPEEANEAAATYVDDTILVATASDFPKVHDTVRDKTVREIGRFILITVYLKI